MLLLAAASGVMGALRHSINEAWDIEERPPLLQRKALDLALILGGTSILALSVSLSVTHRLANILDDEANGGWLLAAALDVAGDVLPISSSRRAALPLPRAADGLGAAARHLAGRRRRRARPRGRKLGLELIRSVRRLGAIYGSLGAAMALLIFVYAAANVIVFGAEFASEWARADDTPARPRSANNRRLGQLRARAVLAVGPGWGHGSCPAADREDPLGDPSRASTSSRVARQARVSTKARKRSGSRGTAVASAAATGCRRSPRGALAVSQRVDLAQARADPPLTVSRYQGVRCVSVCLVPGQRERRSGSVGRPRGRRHADAARAASRAPFPGRRTGSCTPRRRRAAPRRSPPAGR